MKTQKINPRWMILILVMLVALVSGACLTGNTTSSQQEDDTNVILRDDFSNTGSGWEVGEYGGGTVGYEDGVYAVTSYGNSQMMWGLSKEQYDDVEIEVEATQVDAPSSNNNDYGVMCRVQENGDGYSLLVSGDGFYAIQVSENGNFTALVDWTESGKIKEGNATNTIRAICSGDKLVLYVNGTKIAEASDSTYARGYVALAATSYESDSTTIYFDNLVLREP